MKKQLLNIILNKTADGSLRWMPEQAPNNYEYAYKAKVQLRDDLLTLDLYYSDKGNTIKEAVLMGSNKKTKLFHLTNEDFNEVKELAFIFYVKQQQEFKSTFDQAVRGLGSIKANENVEIFKITPAPKWKLLVKKYLKVCLHNWVPFNKDEVCGMCGQIKS